jgi:hypothetical protein
LRAASLLGAPFATKARSSFFQNAAQNVRHVLAEHALRTGFYALFAAGAPFRVLNDDVLVPQKLYFANHLLRAGVNALPARRAAAMVRPHVCGADFAEFVC